MAHWLTWLSIVSIGSKQRRYSSTIVSSCPMLRAVCPVWLFVISQIMMSKMFLPSLTF